ncbi:MAG: hypothetical protein FJ271_22285 [Planctomycetes bacterium]|nr:hypothetical protein [Planctomycetota bacterium]
MAGRATNPVSHLFAIHAADEIRSYAGRLTAVVHAVENNWVPAHDDPGVPELLNTLRQFLIGAGLPEDNLFLLCYGLTAPGMQRGIVPPLMVLEENRGGFSARRQREAEAQIRQLRGVLAIGRFFFPQLDSDAQKAIFELADLCNRLPRPSSAEWLPGFRQLNDVQANQLAVEAIRCLDAGEKSLVEFGTRILQRLACFRDAGLTESTCDDLIARKIFWPSSLYRDTSASVARRLVDLRDHGPDRNLLLLALAWTRSEAALRAFQGWTEHAPPWAKSLYVPPQQYLLSAGWCLDEAGNRRDVISLDCFRLTGPSGVSDGNVVCRRSLSEECPSCGGPKGVLFDFTQTNEDLFSGPLAEAPRRILCCLHCSCYGPVFTRYHPDGTADWLSPLEPNEFAYEDGHSREHCYRTLEASPIPPFACAGLDNLDDASALGGIPMWLQDDEFPRCIDCGRFMTFLAQHDNGPLGEEGLYNAFFCVECRVAGVTYQQT